MNALNELLDTYDFVKAEELKCITDTSEYSVEFSKNLLYGKWKGYIKVTYHHKPTSKVAKDWIKNVAFAKIQYGNDYDGDRSVIELRSNRTEQDELSFLETLASINYDDGYGSQELFGTIVLKDSTWLERGEYDGSEWWERRKLPTEESLFNE